MLVASDVCTCLPTAVCRSAEPHRARTSCSQHSARCHRTPLRAALHQDEGEDLSAEFARVAHPERVKAESSRLELAWQVSKVGLVLAAISGVHMAHRHAELVRLLQWQRRKPLTCTGCQGSGLSDCPFCHGTGAGSLRVSADAGARCRGPAAAGAMTVGEQLFCSLTEGCRGCPACKRKVCACVRQLCQLWSRALLSLCLLQGQVKCKECRGTGFKAGWMP